MSNERRHFTTVSIENKIKNSKDDENNEKHFHFENKTFTSFTMEVEDKSEEMNNFSFK